MVPHDSRRFGEGSERVSSLKIQEQSNQSLEQLIATESIDYKGLSSLANICLSEALIHSSYGKKKTYFKDFAERWL